MSSVGNESSVRNSISSNVRGYDRWAPFYDRYPNPTVAIDELEFPRHWAHVRKKRVLEIGCGTGRHTQKLASAGNEVVAVDPSGGMLAVARKKLATRAVAAPGPVVASESVVFIESEFSECPGLEAESFDAALASLVLEHVTELDRFFEKASGILKRGARLYLSEIHPERAARGRLAHFSDERTGEEVWLVSHAHSPLEIETAAAKSGLGLIHRRDIEGDQRLAAQVPTWDKYVGAPMIQIWELGKRA